MSDSWHAYPAMSEPQFDPEVPVSDAAFDPRASALSMPMATHMSPPGFQEGRMHSFSASMVSADFKHQPPLPVEATIAGPATSTSYSAARGGSSNVGASWPVHTSRTKLDSNPIFAAADDAACASRQPGAQLWGVSDVPSAAQVLCRTQPQPQRYDDGVSKNLMPRSPEGYLPRSSQSLEGSAPLNLVPALPSAEFSSGPPSSCPVLPPAGQQQQQQQLLNGLSESFQQGNMSLPSDSAIPSYIDSRHPGMLQAGVSAHIPHSQSSWAATFNDTSSVPPLQNVWLHPASVAQDAGSIGAPPNSLSLSSSESMIGASGNIVSAGAGSCLQGVHPFGVGCWHDTSPAALDMPAMNIDESVPKTGLYLGPSLAGTGSQAPNAALYSSAGSGFPGPNDSGLQEYPSIKTMPNAVESSRNNSMPSSNASFPSAHDPAQIALVESAFKLLAQEQSAVWGSKDGSRPRKQKLSKQKNPKACVVAQPPSTAARVGGFYSQWDFSGQPVEPETVRRLLTVGAGANTTVQQQSKGVGRGKRQEKKGGRQPKPSGMLQCASLLQHRNPQHDAHVRNAPDRRDGPDLADSAQPCGDAAEMEHFQLPRVEPFGQPAQRTSHQHVRAAPRLDIGAIIEGMGGFKPSQASMDSLGKFTPSMSSAPSYDDLGRTASTADARTQWDGSKQQGPVKPTVSVSSTACAASRSSRQARGTHPSNVDGARGHCPLAAEAQSGQRTSNQPKNIKTTNRSVNSDCPKALTGLRSRGDREPPSGLKGKTDSASARKSRAVSAVADPPALRPQRWCGFSGSGKVKPTDEKKDQGVLPARSGGTPAILTQACMVVILYDRCRNVSASSHLFTCALVPD